jgi:hypothetical protein
MKVINPNSKLKHVFYPETLNLNNGPVYSYPEKYYTVESAIKHIKEYLLDEEITMDYVYIGTFEDYSNVTKEDIQKVRRRLKIDSIV